jgi:hypothetical protein
MGFYAIFLNLFPLDQLLRSCGRKSDWDWHAQTWKNRESVFIQGSTRVSLLVILRLIEPKFWHFKQSSIWRKLCYFHGDRRSNSLRKEHVGQIKHKKYLRALQSPYDFRIPLDALDARRQTCADWTRWRLQDNSSFQSKFTRLHQH